MSAHTRTRDVPYSSDELRRIADDIDRILEHVGGEIVNMADWRWGLTVEIFDEFGAVVGHIRAHEDGWLAFYPVGVDA